MIVQAWSTRRSRAPQQRSTMSSLDAKTRWESQLSRMSCQRVSTGLSSGARGGTGIRGWPAPAPGDAVLLADAGFVLKPRLYPLVRADVLDDRCRRGGEVFSNVSNVSGACL